MKKHLKYEIRSAFEAGAQTHPQIMMRDLGITFDHATPMSVYDCWIFWNCVGIPQELPPYLIVLNIDPMDFVGNGLSKEDAETICSNNVEL